MNLWKWYEKLERELHDAGQDSAAEMLDSFTNHICDLEIEQANALLPEAKGLAKSLGNPWLEVFIGHWEMRNRVGNNLEGEVALADAVALFERAHRPDAIDCPQSVCVTQDLAACYANADGPGWAQARREIAEETLRRIDPTWQCYVCLSNEYAEALQDEGRHGEALAYLDARERELRAAGTEEFEAMEDIRFDSLLALGKTEEGLRLIEEREAKIDGPEWENFRQPRTARKALALARLGRDEEAWDTLPAWEEMAPQHYPKWFKVVAELLPRAPERNTWQLGSRLQAGLEHFARHGAHRILIDYAVIAADLALQRGANWNAQRVLGLAKSHLDKLQADLGAQATLATLSERIAGQAGSKPLPVAAEDLLEWLAQRDGDRNPEEEAEWLCEAVRQLPDDQPLLGLTVEALQACSAHDDAERLLWDFVLLHTEQASGITFQLLSALLQRGQHEQVERLGQCFALSEPAFQHWCRAQLARVAADWNGVIEHCQQILAEAPDRQNTRRLLAYALFRQQRFSEAAEHYLTLAETLEDPNPALWDHMQAATAAGDWSAVRASASRLDIQLDSTCGPIEEDWGWVIIRFNEEGKTHDYYARRTGPVTARILENSVPGEPQHVLDEVIFDPAYLETPPEDEEERQHFVYSFAVEHCLKASDHGRTWVIEGVDPGEERFQALRDELEARDCHVWVHERGYPITDLEDEDRELTGLCFTLSTPDTIPSLTLHQHLQALTADLPDALCWLRLAEHCGADSKRHEEYFERYET